jgi:hypothetical protein
LKQVNFFAALFLIFIFVMKNYCLYVFIGAPKKFLARAPKFLKTALDCQVELKLAGFKETAAIKCSLYTKVYKTSNENAIMKYGNL